MDRRMFKHRLLGLGLLAIGLIAAGCDSGVNTATGEFDTVEVQELYSIVNAELDLSSDQQIQFAEALEQHDHRDREPGFLWIVADSLANTLTQEQIDSIIARTESLEGFHPFKGLLGHPGGGGFYGVGGLRGMSHRGSSPLDEVIDLSETQQADVEALHKRLRERLKSLHESIKAGEATREELIDTIKELHENFRAALDDVLTQAQKDALATYRNQREAEFEAFRAEVIAARDAVLDLTQIESDTYAAIFQDQLDLREVLLEQFENGDLTASELRTEIEALRAAANEMLETLLTEAQYEVVLIHRALSVRMGRRGHRGQGREPGGR